MTSSELFRRIRVARVRRGITQETLAKHCGVSRPAVALWESKLQAHRTEPSVKQLKIISEVTGAPIMWLISDDSGLSGWQQQLDGPNFSASNQTMASDSWISKKEKAMIVMFRTTSSDTKSFVEMILVRESRECINERSSSA